MDFLATHREDNNSQDLRSLEIGHEPASAQLQRLCLFPLRVVVLLERERQKKEENSEIWGQLVYGQNI